jgi:hypothetical protein
MPRGLMWGQLDRPLKVSVLSGIFVGAAGLAVTSAVLSGALPFFFEGAPGALSPFIGSLLLPVWITYLFTGGLFFNSWMLLLYPLFLLSGSLSLLCVSLEKERRGILGFLVFIGSVPILLGLLFGVVAEVASLFGMPVFRS